MFPEQILFYFLFSYNTVNGYATVRYSLTSQFSGIACGELLLLN